MPKIPEWARLALRDISSAMTPAPMITLPWLIMAFTVAPLVIQPQFVFV